MGRALIIIIAITIGVLGLMQINLNSNQLVRVARSADYSTDLQSRNIAHGAIEVTMAQLAADPAWRNSYDPYEVNLDYGTAFVTIGDNTTDTSLTQHQVRLDSRVPTPAKTVLVSVLAERFTPTMPTVRGAINFMDDNFEPNLFGSFSIDGFDRSRSGHDIAGVALLNNNQHSDFSSRNIDGNPKVGVFSDMKYESMEVLINQIRNSATQLEGVITNADLGTARNPGVFMVKDYAKIAGNVKGYGILLVENDTELEISSSLSNKGTFEFNGLVLFKNAWEFHGTGNVKINGAIAVGSPDAVPPTQVDIGGNLTLTYDTKGMDAARAAAFNTVPPTYTILRYYE